MSLADRVAGCSMRPTTMPEIWQRISDHHLVKVEVDPLVCAVFRGCDGVTMYQAAGGPIPGSLYVVVRYPNGTLIWGSPK